ncbi:putative membrane protein [Drosera capensis]
MEPPRGVLSSLLQFLRFLPFFVGILLVGSLKGLGIVASLIGGAAYGFLSPIFATFDAVGPGKTNDDGTWSTVQGSFTVVRDFKDVCYFSYLSFMDDLQCKEPVDGRYYEIRVLYLPSTVLAATFGVFLDLPLISLIALYKGPYMLFKGWQRLIHDLIGREGPFLETICVPFAGLAILLWPLAVTGAVLASVVASVFLGAYAGVVAYQTDFHIAELPARAHNYEEDILFFLCDILGEIMIPHAFMSYVEESSFCMGLRYAVACLAIFDEYSNDVLDMREGTCFPSPKYRKATSHTPSSSSSFSRRDSMHNPPSRTGSLKNPMLELKPLELFDSLFKECKRHGELMVSEGLISLKDIEDAKSSKDSDSVISIGLPAYCILQSLLRSVKANSLGILLSKSI